MLKELTHAERLEIIEHTKRFAANMKTHRKGRYEFKSNFATFSAGYVEDFGNPESAESGIYDDCSTFAEYNAKAREVSSFAEIRKLTLVHSIQSNLKEWILKKNNVSKRNRAAKLEAQKAFSNR